MTNEENLQEVIKLYFDEIKKRGVADPDTTGLAKEVTMLYELYQKDKNLDFDRDKFQAELEAEKERLKGTKLEQVLRAVTSVIGTGFNVWVTKSVLGLETDGVVRSFSGKKIFGTMLGKMKVD